MSLQIHNCHAHVFTIRHVPEKFLPLKLVRFLVRNRLTKPLGRMLNFLNPFSDDDLFQRYAHFIAESDKKSQEEILKSLMRAYPGDAKFVILPMDFEFMGAGRCALGYLQQLDELHALKMKFPENLEPFVAVDPRRPNVLDVVKKHIEERRFSGIKLYPTLGFFPFHQNLQGVYAYAEANEIPIITHCTRGGVFFRGDIPSEHRVHPKTGAKLDGKKNKDFTDHYTDPTNYRYVLEEFPRLKLCFGHFGGVIEWKRYMESNEESDIENSWYNTIKKLIKQYPNVYTDISYTLADFSLLPLLSLSLEDPALRSKILFGSDFYMSRIEGREFKWSIELRDRIDPENYRIIAEENPRRFLRSGLR